MDKKLNNAQIYEELYKDNVLFLGLNRSMFLILLCTLIILSVLFKYTGAIITGIIYCISVIILKIDHNLLRIILRSVIKKEKLTKYQFQFLTDTIVYVKKKKKKSGILMTSFSLLNLIGDDFFSDTINNAIKSISQTGCFLHFEYKKNNHEEKYYLTISKKTKYDCSMSAETIISKIKKTKEIENFIEIQQQLISKLALLELTPLTDKAFSEYILSCINQHDIYHPKYSDKLATIFHFEKSRCKTEVKKGNVFHFIIGYHGLPHSTYPEIMNIYSSIPIELELRKIDRWNILTKDESYQKTIWLLNFWLSKCLSDRLPNIHAWKAREEAYDITEHIRQNNFLMGYYTGIIDIKDYEYKQAKNKAKLLCFLLREKGIKAYIQKINAYQAWFGSLPWDYSSNTRHFFISSLAFSHFVQPFKKIESMKIAIRGE